MSYLEQLRVRPGTRVKLADIDPSFKDRKESQEAAAAEIEHYRKRLSDLQEMLYVERRRSLLICPQGLDAAEPPQADGRPRAHPPRISSRQARCRLVSPGSGRVDPRLCGKSVWRQGAGKLKVRP